MDPSENRSLENLKRKCKMLSCAIQTCLKKKNYEEKNCKSEIEAWRRCVKQLKFLDSSNDKELEARKDSSDP